MTAAIPPLAGTTTHAVYRDDFITATGFPWDINNQIISVALLVEHSLLVPSEERMIGEIGRICTIIDGFIAPSKWYKQYDDDPTHPLHGFVPQRTPSGQHIRAYDYCVGTLREISGALYLELNNSGSISPSRIIHHLKRLKEFLNVLQLIVNGPPDITKISEWARRKGALILWS